MVSLPKITIVTPNFNGGKFIEETILSVTGQNYPNLEYILIDGGSTDGSVDIIRKHEKQLSWWVSEQDTGMYNAIQKGFDRGTGEIMGWINSDDILQKKSLFAIAGIFLVNKEISWVQGYPNVIDDQSRIVYHRPPRYSKYAFYLKDYHDGIFVQQESTFWRRDLWLSTGGHLSDKFRYAGDFELWMRFFRNATLYNTRTFLGSFRIHGSGQISKEFLSEYLSECDAIVNEEVVKLSPGDKKILSLIRFQRKIRGHVPGLLKNLFKTKESEYLNSPLLIDFDPVSNRYILR